MNESLITQILSLYRASPRVAILMSGSGSNVNVILKNAYRYPRIQFITICTDKKESNALSLSEQYGLLYCCIDDKIRNDVERDHYFKKLADYLEEAKIDTILYAGFMKIATADFVRKFPSINVHPADLTITDQHGLPCYVGMNAIADAMNANEKYVASTAHVVDSAVDCGKPIAVSRHLPLLDPLQDAAAVHQQLKTHSEHLLYPFLLELLSKGLLQEEAMPYSWGTLFTKFNDLFAGDLMNVLQETPALDLMYRSQDDSSKVGFDFDHIQEVMQKVMEEFKELQEAFQERTDNEAHFLEEIGDCFFSLVNLCRFMNIHPEVLAKQNVKKYLNRCLIIEAVLKDVQCNWSQLTKQDLQLLWKKAKLNE